MLYNKGDKEVHTFPKGISPKVNVTVWLESELVYFAAVVLHVSHYNARTPPVGSTACQLLLNYLMPKYRN